MRKAVDGGTAARNDGNGSGASAIALALLLMFSPPVPPSPAVAQQLYPATIDVRSFAAIDSLRRLGVDVVEYAPAAGGFRVTAIVDDVESAQLTARGFPARRREPTAEQAAAERRRVALGARAFTVYRDFDDPSRGINAWLRAFTATRSNVRLDSIGASVEGRPVLALKVGPAGDSPARPNVLFMATYHAREWAATEMALRLLAYLADSLPATPAGAALLAARDVWVVPVVNPDGYQYTFAAVRLWRKNRRPNADGSFGVDLNRNHASFFGLNDVGSSPLPGSATYRGTAPESEPETRAIRQLHLASPPDVSVSYHAYTGAILYPWGHEAGRLPPDEPVFRALAGTALSPAVRDRLAGSSLTQYYAAPGWQLYETNGEYADWAYQEFRTIAFTVELTAGCCTSGVWYGFEFPDDEALLEQVFRDNLPFALSLLTEAGNLGTADGPGGTSAAAIEAIWPDVVATLPRGAATFTLDVATDTGAVRTVAAAADTLSRGRDYVRVVAGGTGVVRAARAGALAREIIARDGAEVDGAWQGWARADSGVEGARHWRGGCAGCGSVLESPDIPVAGRSGLALQFRTRFFGSLFTPAVAGVVSVVPDGGAAVPVLQLSGSAPAWYHVTVPLDAAQGASSLRLRFTTQGLAWHVDAIAVTVAGASLFTLTPRAAQDAISVSQNPVRSGSVTLRWTPAGTGAEQVSIFSALGTPLTVETLPAGTGRFVWDGKTGPPGARVDVANGPYYVVVLRGDGRRLRRRLIVAH